MIMTQSNDINSLTGTAIAIVREDNDQFTVLVLFWFLCAPPTRGGIAMVT